MDVCGSSAAHFGTLKPWKFSGGSYFKNKKLENFQGLGVPKRSALEEFDGVFLSGALWLEFGVFRAAQTLEILERMNF